MLGGLLLLLALQAATRANDENLPSVDHESPVSALALVEAFRFNQAAVDELYLDKRVKVTGQLERIERAPQAAETTTAPAYILTLVVDHQADQFKLTFRFEARDRQTLAMLRRHHNVMLEGRCRGETDKEKKELAFDECRFIKVMESASPVTLAPGTFLNLGTSTRPDIPANILPTYAPAFPAEAASTLVPATTPSLPPPRATAPPSTFSPPDSSSTPR
jgi:hypothetical protein